MKDLEKFIYADGFVFGGDCIRTNIRNSQPFVGGNVDILLLGDSIMEGFEGGYYLHKYGSVINRGVGGNTIEQIACRLETDALQLSPKLIILNGGINNRCFLEEAFGKGTSAFNNEKVAFVDRIVTTYKAIIERCKTAKQAIVILSILPMHFPYFYHDINVAVGEANKGIKELCQKEDIPYVDWHGEMVKEDGLTMRDNLSWDGLHPHYKGYEILVQLLNPYLEKFFKEK